MLRLLGRRSLGESGEAGQTAVVLALAMTAMLFAVGLAIDTGQLFVARRTAQAAADAGAFAGAERLYAGGTTAQAISDAIADTGRNGYSAGGTTTVTVNSPPTEGTYAGNASYVEVRITTQVRTTLLPAQATTIAARGVAGVAPVNLGYAVMALDQGSTQGAVGVSSNGSLAITGGGIMVNSSHAQAAQNTGTVTMSAGFNTDVVGQTSGIWPNQRTGRPVSPDPYSSFPKPSTTGLTDYGNPVCCALSPGIYTGSLSGNNDWTMAAGSYIFKGAGVNLAGNSSLNGSGVFIFLTTSSYPSSGGACPTTTFKLTGNNASSLTPPTTGTYKGMLIYQDPACTGDVTIGGNGAITTTGTIYAPTATVEGNGNNSSVAVSQIVAKRVDAGNADFAITYSTAATALPRVPALSE